MTLHIIPFVGGWRAVYTVGEPAKVAATGFWPKATAEVTSEQAKEQLANGQLEAIIIYPGNDEAEARAAAKEHGFTYADEVPVGVKDAAS